MSEIALVHELLDRTIARRRRIAGWVYLWRALLVVALAYLLVLATYKLTPLPADAVRWTALAAALAVPLAFLWGWSRPISRGEAARFLDLQAGLQERLTTALEVSGPAQPAAGEWHQRWRELVVTDAATAAQQVVPQRLLPATLPRNARWAALVLALAAGLGFVPEYRSKAHQSGVATRNLLQETGRGLVQFTKREMAERKPITEAAHKAVEDVGLLGDKLQNAKLSRDDALKDLTKATDALRQQSQDLAKNAAVRQLERAARQSGSSMNQTAEQLRKQIDQMQKELGKNSKEATDAVRELQKDLQKLQEAAKGMANKDGAEARTARAEMAKSLSELAQKALDQGIPLEALKEAAEQLKAANIEQFLKHLEVAEHDLEKMADMARQLKQMQAQAEKIGKDLAEQLKNGQAQAAQQTLQKMMESLQKEDVSKEQLDQIAQECQNGAKPGEKFGKVGDLLKKAAQQAKQGNKAASKQSMAEAKKELDDLMSQMADAEQMASALEALQKAQMCIANGQSWSQSGKAPGGGGKGGKPRGQGKRGFGDWSNDDPWALPDQIAESWDNSGLSRADKDARGLTDRDASTPDNLAPTKIKGQFQPGGAMPSITLKGVSIKGDSKIAYSEAVTSAQSDAQSALNQEQVPKAYKNAVRDYFDDLK